MSLPAGVATYQIWPGTLIWLDLSDPNLQRRKVHPGTHYRGTNPLFARRFDPLIGQVASSRVLGGCAYETLGRATRTRSHKRVRKQEGLPATLCSA